MYRSVSQGIALVCPGRTLLADYTMQDGAREIYNATQTVLDPKVAGSCLFHAAQAIEKRKAEFKSKASFAAFKLDFKKLQGVQSTVIFHHAASLFIALWDPKEPKVAAWFDDEYLKWRQPFYPAATPAGIVSRANTSFLCSLFPSTGTSYLLHECPFDFEKK